MEWPPRSPDLNPIENLRSVVKRRAYRDRRQFSKRVSLWNVIVDAAHSMTQQDIITLTSLMDQRVKNVIVREGSYINIWSCMTS